MPYEEAAKVLGAWAGPSHEGLKPGELLPLDQAQMTELLAETTARGNKRLESALYAHADSVTRAIFGDDVYCGWPPRANECTRAAPLSESPSRSCKQAQKRALCLCNHMQPPTHPASPLPRPPTAAARQTAASSSSSRF